MRLACAMGGLALLAEAAGRAAIVLSFPIGRSLFLGHLPAIFVVIALVLIARFVVAPAVRQALQQDPT